MKSTIIYIHGYESSPNSDKVEQLKKMFPDEIIIAPDVDHSSDPYDIRIQLGMLIKDVPKDSDIILVGSSAGGFWADYFAATYVHKAVLINPSLNPSENYRKYDLPEAFYDKYRVLEKITDAYKRNSVVVFSGENDDVVPLAQIKKRYKEPIILQGEGHRIENMTPILNMIQTMIGNYPEHS